MWGDQGFGMSGENRRKPEKDEGNSKGGGKSAPKSGKNLTQRPKKLVLTKDFRGQGEKKNEGV